MATNKGRVIGQRRFAPSCQRERAGDAGIPESDDGNPDGLSAQHLRPVEQDPRLSPSGAAA